MKDVIQQRIESGERRQDILQYMIETTRAKSSDDRLRIDDIINDVILFLVAGSETSASSMGFLFVEMLRNPGAFKKLQQEIDSIELEDGQTLFHHSQVKSLPYLNASIDETLRMHPANPGGLPRKAVSDTVLGGKVRVPKNVSQTHLAYKLIFLLWLIHPISFNRLLYLQWVMLLRCTRTIGMSLRLSVQKGG